MTIVKYDSGSGRVQVSLDPGVEFTYGQSKGTLAGLSFNEGWLSKMCLDVNGSTNVAVNDEYGYDPAMVRGYLKHLIAKKRKRKFTFPARIESFVNGVAKVAVGSRTFDMDVDRLRRYHGDFGNDVNLRPGYKFRIRKKDFRKDYSGKCVGYQDSLKKEASGSGAYDVADARGDSSLMGDVVVEGSNSEEEIALILGGSDGIDFDPADIDDQTNTEGKD